MRIAIEGLAAGFGSRVLFADLNQEMRSGDMVALMGPSGSGKSTLLAIALGDTKPLAGRVLIDSETSIEASVALLPQSSPLLRHRSVLDNVVLGGVARGMNFEEAAGKARAVLSELGMRTFVRTKVRKISGGERQRTAVARAIVAGADVLLADEPTASLDPVSRSLVCEALRSATNGGAIAIVATHDPFVAEACDRVIILGDQRHDR